MPLDPVINALRYDDNEEPPRKPASSFKCPTGKKKEKVEEEVKRWKLVRKELADRQLSLML